MDRDTKNINLHTEVSFNDVFGEPDHVDSILCSWTNSQIIFTETLNIVYRVFSCMFSFLLTLVFGIKYAVLTFLSVWVIEPTIKLTLIAMEPGKKLYTVTVRCLLDPFCEAFGMCIHTAKYGKDTTEVVEIETNA